MKDGIVWIARKKMKLEKGGEATVYVKHYYCFPVGLIAAADTHFSIPAFVRRKGKRVRGFVTPSDGMAFMQEHAVSHFVEFTNQETGR